MINAHYNRKYLRSEDAKVPRQQQLEQEKEIKDGRHAYMLRLVATATGGRSKPLGF